MSHEAIERGRQAVDELERIVHRCLVATRREHQDADGFLAVIRHGMQATRAELERLQAELNAQGAAAAGQGLDAGASGRNAREPADGGE